MSLLSDLYVRIKGDKTQLDSTLKGAEGSVRAFASKASGLLNTAFALAAVAAMAKFAKAVIGATEALSDKFSFAVAGAKGALTEFLRMAATADFSHFIGELASGYSKAKDLAEALDALKDKRAYVDYITSGKRQESAIQEEIVKDKTGKYSLDRRKKAAADLKEIEADIKKLTMSALRDAYNLEAQGWENRNKLSIEKGKELYENVTSISRETLDKLKEIFEQADKIFRGKDVFGSKAAFIRSKTGGIPDEVVQSFKDYLDLVETGEEDVIPKLFGVLQRYSEGAVAAQERFNGVLRITNTLLGEQAPGGIKRAGIPGKAGTGHLTIPLFAGAPGAGDKLAGAPIAVKEVVDDMKDILQDGVMAVGELAGQLMEGLGTALAGGDMKDIGRGLLESFAGFLQQFGTLLVAYGIARTAFYKSLTSGAAGGGIAIAAGLAMLLAAGAVKGALSKGGGAMSGGGSSGSSGGGGITSQQMKVIVEGRIRGKDIWISNKRYEETNG